EASVGRVVDVGAAWGGGALEAARQVCGVADDGVVHAARAADVAGDDVAGGDADGETELRAGGRDSGGGLVQVAGDGEGARRVVGADARRAEDDHQAVAVEFVEKAVVLEHDVDGGAEEGVEDLDDAFGVEAFGELGEAVDVGEQDRRARAFAAEGDAAG